MFDHLLDKWLAGLDRSTGPRGRLGRGWRTRSIPALASRIAVALSCTILLAQVSAAADLQGKDLTVTAPRHGAPFVPSPLLPGAPIPYSGSPLLAPADLSIVDGRTRFLAPGLAQERCPGDGIVFVPGVVNPFRPTAPGDGAFMCHGDAVAEGFVGR